jgi:hypothetical protein
MFSPLLAVAGGGYLWEHTPLWGRILMVALLILTAIYAWIKR